MDQPPQISVRRAVTMLRDASTARLRREADTPPEYRRIPTPVASLIEQALTTSLSAIATSDWRTAAEATDILALAYQGLVGEVWLPDRFLTDEKARHQ